MKRARKSSKHMFLYKMSCILFIASFVISMMSGSLRADETSSDPNASSTISSIEVATSTPSSYVDLATTTPADLNIDPNSSNSITGADSINNASTTQNTQTNITNENTAVVYNNSFLQSDTGKNNASYNTGSGIITTQTAKGQGELMNVINKNSVQIGVSPATTTLDASNDTTGAGSQNSATTNINNQLTVKNINTSNTINKLQAEVNSGQNVTNYNTGHGIILTGEADLGLNFLSLANTNLVGNQKFYANWQNIFNAYSGDVNLSQEAGTTFSPLSDLLVQASNKSTGADSSNQAIVNVNDQTTIINQNTGKLNNEINANVISGRNQSDQNTGTGSVTTGNVNSSVNVVNFLNSNVSSGNWWFKTINVFGDWNGNFVLPQMPAPNLSQMSAPQDASNSGTGADSQNSADLNVDNSLNIQNANQAVVTNNVNITTNTGNNQTSYNGGSGVVKFGSADAETNEMNVANLNVTGDSWWLVVVNNFGSWQGTAVGSPANLIVKATAVSTVLAPQGSGVLVSNNSTGPDSNNIAGANINHSTDISNANNADILNTLDISAVSGENETQRNTGHGYIDTGNVRATNNIINFANANIAVGNWMVAVVNVFGNWSGNLVFDTSGGTTLSNFVGQGGSSLANQSTGSSSGNTADSTTNTTTNIGNTNYAEVGNNATTSSVTGQNDANYNTGSGIVSTGSASTNSDITNQINNNNIAIGSGACGTGDLATSNSETGATSTNDASVTQNCDTNINNNNYVTSTNNYDINNITGQNSANYNTGNGVIDTSWADTYLGLVNQYNKNKVTMGELVNDFSQASTTTPGGQVEIPKNDNTGNVSSGGGGYGVLTAADWAGYSNSAKKKLRGDFNGDGKIDDFDFSILMANWGKGDKFEKGDANEDGKTNDYDFSIVMGNWTRALAAIK